LDTPFKILFILVPKRIRKLATYSFWSIISVGDLV
jgi:hypothetical protein